MERILSCTLGMCKKKTVYTTLHLNTCYWFLLHRLDDISFHNNFETSWLGTMQCVSVINLYVGYMSTALTLAAQVCSCSTLSTPWLCFVSLSYAWASVGWFLSAWPTSLRSKQEGCDSCLFCIWYWWLLSHQPQQLALFDQWSTDHPTELLMRCAYHNARPSTGDVFVGPTINATGTTKTYGISLVPDNGIVHAPHTFASTVRSSQGVVIYLVALLSRLCCSS